jgi:hypothetical protein
MSNLLSNIVKDRTQQPNIVNDEQRHRLRPQVVAWLGTDSTQILPFPQWDKKGSNSPDGSYWDLREKDTPLLFF